ncbi:restriction endonuclease subunit S [Georgenia muralis]|uniref:restriction endonuclease subunit S n=1 Tax=Georgenia muralis TaxID=154117 RepID=UPI001477583D|nr:restriction endonuclease subunit S [Georgenia muralis]
MGDILELSYGKALKESDRDGGDVPVVGSGGIVGGHSAGITDSPTIVVGRKGSIGSVTWINGPAWPIDTAYFVRPKRDDLDWRWAYWMLRSLRMETMNKSAAVPGLNRDDVYRLTVDVPPRSEQRRIASILDHADALRTKRCQVLTYLDTLPQSIFYNMFGDPDASTENVPFGDVATLAGGRNLVGDDSAADSEYRVLKISAVTTGRFKPGESKPLPPGYVPPMDHLVREGDLLMSRANTTELVGAVAFVTGAPPNLALPDKVWRFSWKSEAEPTFWHALLSTPAIRRRISRLASGTGGSMKNVAKAKLEVMPVPHVKLERQREFADRSAQIEVERVRLQRALTADLELFRSLQSRAFRGELG